MRGNVMLVALSVLALGACSSVVEGPRAPADQADLAGSEAVIQAGVRGAAAAFVEAYAATGEDRGSALRGLVAGRTLPRWVHWMGVQNEQFPGSIAGDATVAAVGPARHAELANVNTDDRFIREVDLAAQVNLQATPTQGEPIPLTWVLDGPMLIVIDPSGTWKVTDFHRGGVPMSVIFQLVEGVDLAVGPRVKVALDSFVAAPTWQFNLMVTVEGGSPISLPTSGATLVDGAGDLVDEAGDVSQALSSIEPGTPSEGVVAFQGRSDATDLLLRLDLQTLAATPGAPDVPIVEIPLEGVIQPLPLAEASPSP